MTPTRFAAFMERLALARNTEDLFELELRFAPFDESDPLAADALFHLMEAAAMFSRGPAPSRVAFQLEAQPPEHAAQRFTVRGRLDSRIVSVTWADGALYGSRFAACRIARRVGDPAALSDPVTALATIRDAFSHVLSEEGSLPRVA